MKNSNINLLIFTFGILFQLLIVYTEVYQIYFYVNGKIIYGIVEDVKGRNKNKLTYYINNKKVERMVRLKENENIKLICIQGSNKYLVFKLSNFILTDLLRLIVFVGGFLFLKHFLKNVLRPSME